MKLPALLKKPKQKERSPTQWEKRSAKDQPKRDQPLKYTQSLCNSASVKGNNAFK